VCFLAGSWGNAIAKGQHQIPRNLSPKIVYVRSQ
jgi:hypothetical protein